MLISFYPVQNEYFSGLTGERCDRSFQIHADAGIRCCARFFEGGGVVGGEYFLCLSLLRFRLGQHQIDCQTMQPCRESAVSPERIQLLSGANERFLGEIFRLGFVPDHSYTQGVYPAEVLVI